MGFLCLVFVLVLYDLDENERAGCFVLVVVLLSSGCWFSMALLRGSLGWTTVCGCGLS